MGKGSFLQGLNEKPMVQLDQEIQFPHSIGLLYSAFTAFLGFQVNEGEYKVMGMAPYGSPNYLDEVKKLVKYEEDGSFRLNMDYFSFTHSLDRTYTQKFIDLFGNPRRSNSEFYTLRTHPERDHPNWDNAIVSENRKYADIAASIQLVTEEIILKMVKEAYRRTGLKKLCMAGGVTLNSVSEWKDS